MTKYLDVLTATRPGWLGGGDWVLSGLRDITVLLGRNGTGKSYLLRDLNSRNRAWTHYSSPERAGDLVYDANVAQQEFDPITRGNSRINRNTAANYRRESLTRLGTVFTMLGVDAGFQRPVPPMADRTEEMLRGLLPGFEFKIERRPPFLFGYRVPKDGGDLQPIGDLTTSLSSGETEALTVALDLLTMAALWQLEKNDGDQRLLLVDEPDPHLHPDLQVRFARFLVALSMEFRCQVLVATHSTTLAAALGALAGDLASVAYMGQSAELQAVRFDDAVQRLVNALGGHALLAPLLGAKLLLVEGIDDYTVWSHVPRTPQFSDLFAILPAGGQRIREHQMALEQLFEGLRDPGSPVVGYALLDGDKSTPTDIPTNHIAFIRVSCREVENLYLTDEVLARLGRSWVELAADIAGRAEAGEFGAKSAALSAAPGWDRSTVDLKGLMHEVVSVADPATVPWQVRLGQVLARTRPSGQLAQFLGQEVMDALWGPEVGKTPAGEAAVAVG